ncbi:hypothetical protein DRO64_01750 [Candidatus Bathyarchaeota archaeon]|nr:MAG: hypothetical protein DRO64_01750 [Candidatus Bathyarchaeota archaeon]
MLTGPMGTLELSPSELESLAERIAEKIVERVLSRAYAKLDEIETLIKLLRRFAKVALEHDSIINRKLDEIRGVLLLVDEEI